MVNYTCRGARPSVTTLPNEAVSLKGKQLRTLSCVPAWLKLVKTVDFGSVHALFVFYSVIHFQQAIFAVALHFEIWFHDRFDLFDLFNLAFLDTALTRSTR